MNRDEIYRAMRELVDRRRAEGRPCLMFLHGPEGIGASALAVELFERDPACFGGLRIWVPARQPDDMLVPPGEILRQLLRGLGVADIDQDSALVDRAAEFQRVSSGRRFLAVIDDVGSAEQVTPAIPAGAPDAVVLVTSRARLQGLINSDFVDFGLDRLPLAESRALFRKRLGSTVERVDASTVDELADLCGGFPLLLRMLAAQIMGRPHRARRLLSELRQSTAAFLMLDDQQRMTRFLDLAHDGLTREQALAHRQLSLIPGYDFGVEVAAAMLQADSYRAESLLDELVEANLLTFERGRFRFHEIIRADAQIRALRTDGPQPCGEAVGRATSWYLHEAARHDLALSDRWRVGPVFERLAEEVGRDPTLAVERGRAVEWFTAEWRNVAACVRAAHRQGLQEVAWQCCVALWKFVHLNRYVEPWIDTHNVGLESARMDANTAAVMQLSSQRGAAHLAAGEPDQAHQDFLTSLAAAREAGHELGEQSALEWLGKVAAAEADFAAALHLYDQSWQVTLAAGDAIPPEQRGRIQALLRLQRARALLGLERWDGAKVEATAALGYFQQRDKETENHAKCLLTLGEALLGAGAAAPAVEPFERALDLFAADRARRPQAQALELFGDAVVAAGDRDRGAAAYRRALCILNEIGAAEASRLSRKLGDLGQPPA